jgi:hypothetical protein
MIITPSKYTPSITAVCPIPNVRGISRANKLPAEPKPIYLCHNIAVTQWYSKSKRKNRFAKDANALNISAEELLFNFL